MLTRAGAAAIHRAANHAGCVASEAVNQMQLLWSQLLSRHAADGTSSRIAIGKSNGIINGMAKRPDIKRTGSPSMRDSA